VDLVFRQLVAGLSLRRPGARFQVSSWHWEILLPPLLLCPVSIFHTHLSITIIAIITNGWS